MAQREGAALLQSIQNAKQQQQTDERVRSVNESQDTGEGSEAIKDKNGQAAGQEGRRQGESSEETEEKDKEAEGVIRDPALGKNIDVSL